MPLYKLEYRKPILVNMAESRPIYSHQVYSHTFEATNDYEANKLRQDFVTMRLVNEVADVRLNYYFSIEPVAFWKCVKDWSSWSDDIQDIPLTPKEWKDARENLISLAEKSARARLNKNS